ncbi:hypothetical protein F9278_26800 [Streptomyces phaeolivaceus]|uniref:Tetratricopeptide repeat protein n=1 Tax=Streptomyces phaeolivaceus TaxID=2653200 RepID=A0A5P8K826_9ACTN|nr:hypothetical protein [Streptomyces phaeolivaceus]QFQ99156.1 hypothetical protein F9278_26800 [Streptomyces phaeolivaceus]
MTEAVRRLAAHSMITVRGELLSVHRLVQAVSRAGEPQEVIARRDHAVAMLVRHQPDALVDIDEGRLWAIHVEALGECVEEESDTEALTSLFAQAAALLAHGYSRRSVALADRFGRAVASHPEWEAGDLVRRTLLPVYTLNGEPSRAVPLAEYQLGLRKATLGEGHPKTIEALISLAKVVRYAGSERARSVAEQAVETATGALGPDHLLTFKAESTLRDITEQRLDVPALETLLKRATRLFGADHIVSTELRYELVVALAGAGEPGRAAALAEMAARRCGAVLGAADLRTLSFRVIHLSLVAQTGDIARARELLPQIVADFKGHFVQEPDDRGLLGRITLMFDELVDLISGFPA